MAAVSYLVQHHETDDARECRERYNDRFGGSRTVAEKYREKAENHVAKPRRRSLMLLGNKAAMAKLYEDATHTGVLHELPTIVGSVLIDLCELEMPAEESQTADGTDTGPEAVAQVGRRADGRRRSLLRRAAVFELVEHATTSNDWLLFRMGLRRRSAGWRSDFGRGRRSAYEEHFPSLATSPEPDPAESGSFPGGKPLPWEMDEELLALAQAEEATAVAIANATASAKAAAAAAAMHLPWGRHSRHSFTAPSGTSDTAPADTSGIPMSTPAASSSALMHLYELPLSIFDVATASPEQARLVAGVWIPRSALCSLDQHTWSTAASASSAASTRQSPAASSVVKFDDLGQGFFVSEPAGEFPFLWVPCEVAHTSSADPPASPPKHSVLPQAGRPDSVYVTYKLALTGGVEVDMHDIVKSPQFVMRLLRGHQPPATPAAMSADGSRDADWEATLLAQLQELEAELLRLSLQGGDSGSSSGDSSGAGATGSSCIQGSSSGGGGGGEAPQSSAAGGAGGRTKAVAAEIIQLRRQLEDEYGEGSGSPSRHWGRSSPAGSRPRQRRPSHLADEDGSEPSRSSPSRLSRTSTRSLLSSVTEGGEADGRNPANSRAPKTVELIANRQRLRQKQKFSKRRVAEQQQQQSANGAASAALNGTPAARLTTEKVISTFKPMRAADRSPLAA